MERLLRSLYRKLFGRFSSRKSGSAASSQQALSRSPWRRGLALPLSFEVLEDRTLLSGLTNAVLTPTQTQDLVNGLNGLATWSQGLDQSGLFAQTLPVVDTSLGQALNLGNLLQTQLANPVVSAAPTSTNNLVSVLDHLSASTNGLTVTVNPSTVSGGQLTSSTDNELQFNLVLDASRTTTAGFDPGSNASTYGFSITGAPVVTVTSQFAFNFTFGLDLAPNLSSSNAFFIRVSSLTASASATLSNGNFNAQIGFLGLAVANASITLNAGVSATFLNPDQSPTDNINLTDLQSDSLASVVAVAPTSSTLAATLPLQASLGTWTAAGSPQVTLASANVFAGTAPTVTFNSAAQPLLNFTDLTPSDFTTIFNQLGTSLQASSSSLNLPESANVPFIGQHDQPAGQFHHGSLSLQQCALYARNPGQRYRPR